MKRGAIAHGGLVALLLPALAALTACGEKAQVLVDGKQDTASFQGKALPFGTAGWKQGDRTGWEQQLKTRTQQGQNEYAKTN